MNDKIIHIISLSLRFALPIWKCSDLTFDFHGYQSVQTKMESDVIVSPPINQINEISQRQPS